MCGRIAGRTKVRRGPVCRSQACCNSLGGALTRGESAPTAPLCPRQRTGSDDFCRSDFSRPRTLINGLPVIQRADGRLKSPLQVSPALRAGSTQRGVGLPPQMPFISARTSPAPHPTQPPPHSKKTSPTQKSPISIHLSILERQSGAPLPHRAIRQPQPPACAGAPGYARPLPAAAHPAITQGHVIWA